MHGVYLDQSICKYASLLHISPKYDSGLITLSCLRQVDVLIQILDGESTQITFQGAGYNPNIVGEAATSSQLISSAAIPSSAKLTVPGQVSQSVGYEQYDQSRDV